MSELFLEYEQVFTGVGLLFVPFICAFGFSLLLWIMKLFRVSISLFTDEMIRFGLILFGGTLFFGILYFLIINYLLGKYTSLDSIVRLLISLVVGLFILPNPMPFYLRWKKEKWKEEGKIVDGKVVREKFED